MCPRKPAVDQERPRHLPASNRVKEFSACAPGGGFPLLGGPRALNPARPRSVSQVRHEVKRKDDLRSRPMAIGTGLPGNLSINSLAFFGQPMAMAQKSGRYPLMARVFNRVTRGDLRGRRSTATNFS